MGAPCTIAACNRSLATSGRWRRQRHRLLPLRPILDNLLLTVGCHAAEKENPGDRQEEAQIQVLVVYM
jgi:hypothetical protein